MGEIRLPRSIKTKYSEIVPVLSGQGPACSITLLGRLRDDPAKLDKILTQLWKPGEKVTIHWEESPVASSQ